MKKSMILLAGPAYLLVLACCTCTRFDSSLQADLRKQSASQATHFLSADDLPEHSRPVTADSASRNITRTAAAAREWRYP